jgi:hypothetical protein
VQTASEIEEVRVLLESGFTAAEAVLPRNNPAHEGAIVIGWRG